MINVTRFAFFDFDMSSQNSQLFISVISSEAISIDELGSIVPKLHTYTTFFLLKFIFHKKLQVVFGYRGFFFAQYIWYCLCTPFLWPLRFSWLFFPSLYKEDYLQFLLSVCPFDTRLLWLVGRLGIRKPI